MTYKILETHLIYNEEKLEELIVLWKDGNSVRATYSTLNPKAGYVSLSIDDEISPKLFQKVAGGGSYLDNERKEKYFPKITNWSK